MKLYSLILFFVCLNFGYWLVDQCAYPSSTQPYAGNIAMLEQYRASREQMLNPPTDPLSTIIAAINIVIWGILELANLFIWMVAGLPLFLAKTGAPLAIQTIVDVIVGIIWTVSLIQLYTGRKIKRG